MSKQNKTIKEVALQAQNMEVEDMVVEWEWSTNTTSLTNSNDGYAVGVYYTAKGYRIDTVDLDSGCTIASHEGEGWDTSPAAMLNLAIQAYNENKVQYDS